MSDTVGQSATARANANIAFIKYWGNIDDDLRLPANPSISMNLDGLFAQTTVTWRDDLPADQLILNYQPAEPQALRRVSTHLSALRQRLAIRGFAAVESANNFPTGAGIASSAAAFAALTVAAVTAAGKALSERELTMLARLGSGSASRSVPSGFVEWHSGATHEESFAESIAAPDHWDIVDVIAIVSRSHKTTGSSEGHQSANSSDYQASRVAGAAERLAICKRALLERDFAMFAEIVERDSNMMHAVMMTSRPALFYWQPATLAVMETVREWRAEGLRVCYTLDAGPNVHCICVREDMAHVRDGLKRLSDVPDVLVASPGGPAYIIETADLSS